MRDPDHPAWPEKGERTDDPAVAEKWRWAYMALAQGEVRRQQLKILSSETLKGARERFIEHRTRAKRSPQTIRNDESALRVLADKVGWDFPLYDITSAHVQAALDALVDAGYAPSTVQTYQVHLSGFFRWAAIRPNPARRSTSENDDGGVVIPEIPEPEIFTWSDAEIERLQEAADEIDAEKHRNARLLVDTGLATGARFRELLALRWEDFDPHSRTVRIVRQVLAYQAKIGPTKSRRGRTAVVLPFFWGHYRPDARGPVLPGPAGGLMHSKYAEDVLQAVLKRAGLNGPQRAFHDLRRTYGRLFLEAGGWMDELQRSLGHRSIRTTERQYGKFQEDVAASFAVDRIYGDGRARRLRVVG